VDFLHQLDRSQKAAGCEAIGRYAGVCWEYVWVWAYDA